MPAGGAARMALTFNGDLAAFESSNTSFSYYEAGALGVSTVLPVAGPSAGGSLLNVSGGGFGALGGVFCRFALASRTTAGTAVGNAMIQCRSPRISGAAALGGGMLGVPAGGQREAVEVSVNGQDYTSGGPRFIAFDQRLVHVSSLVPHGGPLAGGTRVVVLGSGFADHNVHCRIGGEGSSVLARAVVLNASALECVAPAHASAEEVAVEVTLNGDIANHTLSSDGVLFAFYNASAVEAASVAPLGGPTGGGTLVVVRGMGYADHGGVFCRFGASAVVAATLRSSTELACVSPSRFDTADALDAPAAYEQVHSSATCCAAGSTRAEHLGGLAAGSASSAASCEAGCTALEGCRFFSHSLAEASCEWCADCAYERATSDAVGHTSWRRIGAASWAVRLQLLLNGADGTRLPSSLPAVPLFTYYAPHALVVSAVVPSGGPVGGGTAITLHGVGALARGDVSCRFGSLQLAPARALAVDGSSLVCDAPPQPDVTTAHFAVRSADGGRSAVGSGVALATRWTVDGCHGTGAAHEPQCTPVEGGRASFSCCSQDGATCHPMCISPVDGSMCVPRSRASLS